MFDDKEAVIAYLARELREAIRNPEGDWDEDADEYGHKCPGCDLYFCGNLDRTHCRACAGEPARAAGEG